MHYQTRLKSWRIQIPRRKMQRRIWPINQWDQLTPISARQQVVALQVGPRVHPATFMVVTKDADGRKVPNGGAVIKVRVSPGVGVGGTEQEGIVKDMGDGTYTVTYVVPKRGNYMVTIECNGKAIMGSPFPVFFSAGTSTGGLLGMAPATTFPNLVNQTMPNMPNYSANVSGAFPALLGMTPGIASSASGGAILPGVGASLGEVCREYLYGRCAKTDCKLSHPPQSLLMTLLAPTTSMGTLSMVPMAPSAAAMAAAQAIVAAKALQAHAAQLQAQAQSAKDSSGSPDKARKEDALKKTLHVSNLSPLLTVEQLKQLFSFCGTVVECTVADSKHSAYIEYLKPEEATAALALNNMDVGGRPLNVEMAKSLPPKPILNSSFASSSLPMMMQQAVAMQQMQFQQALLMQQTMNAQQAANKAATMKSATELAAAKAAEISKKLKDDGFVTGEGETKAESKSPSPARARSKSKSRSPINYRRRLRSPSYSPPSRYNRDRRSRSPVRFRYHSRYNYERLSYRDRDSRDDGDRTRRRELDRSRDHHSPVSRRNRNRGASPQTLKNPTELIQARQNIAKKAQLIDQEKHQIVVQDHLSIMKEVDHPQGTTQIASSDTEGAHALDPNQWKKSMIKWMKSEIKSQSSMRGGLGHYLWSLNTTEGGHPLEVQMKMTQSTEVAPGQNLWKLNAIPMRK
ncbi:SERINE/ARGININE-RICH SPLICING FACTOR [Salix koriyanagi]|uniref:SERINE/ARGININE-RICH SPLICING FACTOR n=1 Tax=Salix koriyanagi TaxID=2511006 RepID=A0A9Q0PMV4_9ROSI|nr:SERINE/ARGININE-RICH SPLICING FACTOR [Salix koriyanagi]